MPTSLGPAEILVILVVALVVLGPKRLPEAGRQIGKFVSEVRHWSSAVQAEISNVIDLQGEPQPPAPAPAAPPASTPVQPPPMPTPQDLSPTSTPTPGPKPQQSAAAEWGLAEPGPDAEPAPPPAPAPPSLPPPSTSGGLPPEWSTPPSANGNN